MGVNIICQFNNNVRGEHLAQVLGKLAGLPSEMYSLGWHSYEGEGRRESFAVRVEGAQETSGAFIYEKDGVSLLKDNIRGTTNIDLRAPKDSLLVDGESYHHVMFHYESSDRSKGVARGLGKIIIPPSTPFWCAVCKRAVQYFGGWLVYNDSVYDGEHWDLVVRTNWSRCDTSNANWAKLQNSVHKLKPVTYEDMMAMMDVAAYAFERQPITPDELAAKIASLNTTPPDALERVVAAVAP